VAEGLDAHRTFRREQGDFEALFRAHYGEIARYLTARLGSRDDALELASEVFAEAWRRVPGSNGAGGRSEPGSTGWQGTWRTTS
jgi:DNA-directed RNA polymerase specialized sigma24 family protein